MTGQQICSHAAHGSEASSKPKVPATVNSGQPLGERSRGGAASLVRRGGTGASIVTGILGWPIAIFGSIRVVDSWLLSNGFWSFTSGLFTFIGSKCV